MGLFSKLFKKKDATVSIATDNMSFKSPECQSLWDLKIYMDDILSQTAISQKVNIVQSCLTERKLSSILACFKAADC